MDPFIHVHTFTFTHAHACTHIHARAHLFRLLPASFTKPLSPSLYASLALFPVGWHLPAISSECTINQREAVTLLVTLNDPSPPLKILSMCLYTPARVIYLLAVEK